MVNAHTKGRQNWTLEIHRALTLELLQRQLIERLVDPATHAQDLDDRLPRPSRWPTPTTASTGREGLVDARLPDILELDH